MGIPFRYLQKMDELGIFSNGNTSILDIGSSNLYSADAAGLKTFINKYRRGSADDLDAFAERFAAGSAYDPVAGGLNKSFAGELFEKIGMEYQSFDIADGYKTRILDLNHAAVPPDLANHFDVVLNFGTTEHILNQYNCFKVMHDATKTGGYIYHSLPGIGYVDHGYITYTSRCFFDLAGYNGYEVVDFWFEGPGGDNNLYEGVRSYRTYFPALQNALDEIGKTERGNTLNKLYIPDVSINIIYRKVNNKPFWGALESSTSVGNIPNNVTSSYASVGSSGSSTGLSPLNLKSAQPEIELGTSTPDIIGGVARRSYRAFRPPMASIFNHHPELQLTGEAHELREKFADGHANLVECLRLYELVTKSGKEFPIDWEEKILRLGLEQHPERRDLAERLEVVSKLMEETSIAEATPAPKPVAGTTVLGADALLQEALASFRKRQLVELSNRQAIIEQYEGVIRDAIAILNNKSFLLLPIATQAEIITTIYNTVASGLPREAATLGDIISWHFARILRNANVDDVVAFRLYDILYGLYFIGASSLSEMKRFDSACVGPFVGFLQRRLAERRKVPESRKLERPAQNVCYFFHCAHFEQGNAVAPMFVALAKAHALVPGRRVFAYCVQWVSDDFPQAFENSGVTVRSFPQNNSFNRLDEIAGRMKTDAIDVAISELNSSIAAYLFMNRVAPIQMWIDTGYPYWSIPAVDWVLLPGKDYQSNFGVQPDRFSYLRVRQELPVLVDTIEESKLAGARAILPSGTFVFATFVRLSKITREFLMAAGKLLERESGAHLLIVGTGDPRLIYDFMDEESHQGRVTFIHHNVDLRIYGRVVDVFLDTFPFIGGNACREVAIHGKPVLALRSADWERLLLQERDPALLTPNIDAYVETGLKLASDPDFYKARAANAIQLAIKTSSMEDMVVDVEDAVAIVMARDFEAVSPHTMR